MLLLVLGGGLVLTLALLRAYGLLEFRTRLLEMLALAVARGAPLGSFFARAAMERKGRTRLLLHRMHARLREGGTLSSACAAGGWALFPPHVLGAVRAAEGTAALAGALDAASRDATAALHLRHRWLLVAAYPLLLIAILSLVMTRLRIFAEMDDLARMPWTAHVAPPLLWGAAGAAALAFAVRFALRRLCVFEGARLLAAERLLRALAPHIAANLPLQEALRRAAPACGNRSMAAGARDAARELDAGTDPSRALPEIPLPRFVQARLAAGNHEALADECAARYRDRAERVLRWALPLALLVLGMVAALLFAGVMEFLAEVRRSILW